MSEIHNIFTCTEFGGDFQLSPYFLSWIAGIIIGTPLVWFIVNKFWKRIRFMYIGWKTTKRFGLIVIFSAIVLATMWLSNIECDHLHIIPFLFVLLSSFIFIWQICDKATNNYMSQQKVQNLKLLAGAMFFVWSCGFFLYSYALAIGCCKHSSAELLFRSASSSIMLFFNGADSNVLDNIKSCQNQPLRGLLSATGFLAIVCTVILIINLIISRFSAYLKLWFLSVITTISKWHQPKRLYVFWGMNEQSIILAKDIQRVEEKRREEEDCIHWYNIKKYRIIFIGKNLSTSDDNESEGWRNLINIFIHRMDTFRLVKNLNAYFAIMNDKFRMSYGNVVHANDDILEEIGLPQVRSIIMNLRKTESEVDKSELHMFCLGNKEERKENLFSAAILQKDRTIVSCAKENGKNAKVVIHCHARYNSVNKVIEDFNSKSGVEIRIVDSSHLSIELLKREQKYQPISFVEIDKDKNYGTVKTPFNCLIVGFGETGKDALRFLYEFGAFVDSSSDEVATKRSPFSCYVVDSQLNKLKGAFINAAPSMIKDNLITWRHVEYNSNVFYDNILIKISDVVNYVVIAIGNDEEGITLAVRILKYLRRQGRKFDKLRIFVRSYDPELYPHMLKIADHYNEDEERIVIFGKNEDIYSYNLIVKDEFEERGKDYYDAYRTLNPENDEDGTWIQRKKKLKGIIKLEKTGIDGKKGLSIFTEIPIGSPCPPTLNNLQKLRRKEYQDKSNALHELTKDKILETVIPNWYSTIIPKLYEYVQTDSTTIVRVKRQHEGYTTQYTDLSPKEQKLFNNLAKLEHIRWIASHEVLGYIPIPSENTKRERECDETLATHNCLVSWEELDEESKKVSYIDDYKLFDYGVVETTIDNFRKMEEKRRKKK